MPRKNPEPTAHPCVRKKLFSVWLVPGIVTSCRPQDPAIPFIVRKKGKRLFDHFETALPLDLSTVRDFTQKFEERFGQRKEVTLCSAIPCEGEENRSARGLWALLSEFFPRCDERTGLRSYVEEIRDKFGDLDIDTFKVKQQVDEFHVVGCKAGWLQDAGL